MAISQNAYPCIICATHFATKSEQADHLSTVHSFEHSWLCHQCPEAFEDEGGLNTHETATHPRPGGMADVHQCPICGLHFASENMALRHKQQDHTQQARRTGQGQSRGCGKSGCCYSNDSCVAYSVHTLHQHQVKCDACGVRFKEHSELVKHRDGACLPAPDQPHESKEISYPTSTTEKMQENSPAGPEHSIAYPARFLGSLGLDIGISETEERDDATIKPYGSGLPTVQPEECDWATTSQSQGPNAPVYGGPAPFQASHNQRLESECLQQAALFPLLTSPPRQAGSFPALQPAAQPEGWQWQVPELDTQGNGFEIYNTYDPELWDLLEYAFGEQTDAPPPNSWAPQAHLQVVRSPLVPKIPQPVTASFQPPVSFPPQMHQTGHSNQATAPALNRLPTLGSTLQVPFQQIVQPSGPFVADPPLPQSVYGRGYRDHDFDPKRVWPNRAVHKKHYRDYPPDLQDIHIFNGNPGLIAYGNILRLATKYTNRDIYKLSNRDRDHPAFESSATCDGRVTSAIKWAVDDWNMQGGIPQVEAWLNGERKKNGLQPRSKKRGREDEQQIQASMTPQNYGLMATPPKRFKMNDSQSPTPTQDWSTPAQYRPLASQDWSPPTRERQPQVSERPDVNGLRGTFYHIHVRGRSPDSAPGATPTPRVDTPMAPSAPVDPGQYGEGIDLTEEE